MKNHITYLIFIFFTSIFYGQQEEDFIQNLLNFQFEDAYRVGQILDKEKNIPYHKYIVQLRYNSGQDRNSDLAIKNLLEDLAFVENEALHFYTLGLYYFNNNISSGETFLYLKKSFEKIPQEERSYKKLILITFCELYAEEMVQSSDEYLNYLEDFEALASSKVDRFWKHYHKNKYLSKITGLRISQLLEEFTKFEKFVINNRFSEDVQLHYLYTKAMNHRLQGETRLAQKSYDEVIKIGNQKPYLKYFVFTSLIHQVKIYSNQSQFEKAKELLASSTSFWNKSDSLRSQFINNRFSALNYYEHTQSFDSAYYSLKKSIENEYLLDFRTNTLKNSEQNALLQTAEKEKQILEEQAQKERNRNIAYALATSLLLLTIIATLIHRNTKRKQRIAEQEKELQIQKTTTVLKEQEINTINAMVEGQEKERLRIAGDLHDSLGGTLAAVKMHIGNLQHNLDKTKNPQELLAKADELISEAYKNVRSIAHERNSGVMAKEGLLPAIQKLADKVSASGGLSIEVQDFGLEERLSNHLEITIFRIVQELVTNVIKHAEATEIQISLTQHEEELNIVVEDNGKGFKVGKLEEKDGMGLGSIERRIEHLEGTMLVDSTLGKGTNIIIDIPL